MNKYNRSTLGTKECEIAIIDEVDSMLIDDSSKIARLSSTAAGMDYFQVVYVYIWQRLLTIRERLVMFNDKMYMVNGQIGFEDRLSNFKFTKLIVDEKIKMICCGILFHNYL